MAMTPDERAAIQVRTDAATPGPWFAWRATTEFVGWTVQVAAGWLFKQSDKANEHDAEFIAHARTDVPALLADNARLEAAIQALVEKWREAAGVYAMRGLHSSSGRADQAKICADELSALLTDAGRETPAQGAEGLERWRHFYRALAWLVNDYIGVCGASSDFTKKDERLGYAHEGYHNARRVLYKNKPPVPERLQRFNDGTGCLYSGNSHPDRCMCQEKETGQFAGTPHKHRDEPPYGCARCKCEAYEPALVSRTPAALPAGTTPIQLNAKQIAAAKSWAANDGLWTTQETVEFNLRTFARKVISLASSSTPTGRAEGDEGRTTKKTV